MTSACFVTVAPCCALSKCRGFLTAQASWWLWRITVYISNQLLVSIRFLRPVRVLWISTLLLGNIYFYPGFIFMSECKPVWCNPKKKKVQYAFLVKYFFLFFCQPVAWAKHNLPIFCFFQEKRNRSCSGKLISPQLNLFQMFI